LPERCPACPISSEVDMLRWMRVAHGIALVVESGERQTRRGKRQKGRGKREEGNGRDDRRIDSPRRARDNEAQVSYSRADHSDSLPIQTSTSGLDTDVNRPTPKLHRIGVEHHDISTPGTSPPRGRRCSQTHVTLRYHAIRHASMTLTEASQISAPVHLIAVGGR
jgi:hypothetical protein